MPAASSSRARRTSTPPSQPGMSAELSGVALPSSTVTDDPTPSTPDTPTSSPSANMPDYKGAPLDAEAGPGLGCFWFQVGLLVLLLVLTPISVWAAAPSWVSALLLIIVLVLLFFVGQTMVFLLRLVAADRRTRRRPISSSARRTVGQIEDEQTGVTGTATRPSDQDDSTPDEPL